MWCSRLEEQADYNAVVDWLSFAMHGKDDLPEILKAALERETEAVWGEIASRLEAGSWRISMSVRPWLLAGIDLGPIKAWIGGDVERARTVARIAPIGGQEPTPVARHLLDEFGEDADVGSSFYGALVSGSWVGNESDRIQRQIDQLNSWRDDKREPHGLRRWAADVVQSLTASKQGALEREAERDF